MRSGRCRSPASRTSTALHTLRGTSGRKGQQTWSKVGLPASSLSLSVCVPAFKLASWSAVLVCQSITVPSLISITRPKRLCSIALHTPLHTTTRYTSISFTSPFASTIDLSRPFIRRVHSQSLAVHGTHALAADVTAAYSVAFAHCPSSPPLPLPYSHNLVLPSLLDPTC
jgi:hypothetical protein